MKKRLSVFSLVALFSLMLTGISLVPCDSALAANIIQYDVVSDWREGENPNGPWSYGWKSDLWQSLNMYDRYENVTVPAWLSSSIRNIYNIPSAWKNTNSNSLWGVSQGEVALHPGPEGEISVCRWTAPQKGTISVQGYFGAGDTNQMSYYIFKNDSTSVFEMKNTYGDGNFSFNEEVSAGDTIDFMVGLGSNGYYCGNIPIHAIIKLTGDSQPDNSQPGNGSSNSSCRFVVGSSYYEVDGVQYVMDAAPYIDQGRTFVPITYVARALGIDIAWDGGSQSANLSKGAITVQIKIGSNIMQVNGLNVMMDVSPRITNGRTCLPISPVCQAFGKQVNWNSSNQTISIN